MGTALPDLLSTSEAQLRAWQRSSDKERSAIHEQMQAMCAATMAIQGRVAHAMLHTKTATGQMSVRWRLNLQYKHVTWDKVDEALAGHPRVVRQWYAQANTQIELLNIQELIARQSCAAATKALKVLVDSNTGESKMPDSNACDSNSNDSSR